MVKKEENTIISFFGRMNAGKSTLFNLLSGQKGFALVDSQPGTTADIVMTKMQIHGIGPVKLCDTPGFDEVSALGEKKRKKVLGAIEESDLAFLVVNLLKNETDAEIEKTFIKRALSFGAQLHIIYNIFPNSLSQQELARIVSERNQKINFAGIPFLCVNALDFQEQKKLVEFIREHYKKEEKKVDLVPLSGRQGYVLLNIPMDEETPSNRLLRPQDMVVEHLLRKGFIPVLFKMNLTNARENVKEEKERFLSIVNNLTGSNEGLKLIITDSQAIDILDSWSPRDIKLTTFSIIMANYMSFGNLPLFIEGLRIFSQLKDNDPVLIMESCNHDRKCNDIGTRQIPRLIKEKLKLDLKIDFSFGRVLPENLNEYKAVIHCGGCMIDRQKYCSRILHFKEKNVLVTNYGIFLTWLHNPKSVARVTELFTQRS